MEQLNPEPRLWSLLAGAQAPWSPRATREAAAARSLHIATKSSLHLLQLEKACARQPRPTATKNKQLKKRYQSLRHPLSTRLKPCSSQATTKGQEATQGWRKRSQHTSDRTCIQVRRTAASLLTPERTGEDLSGSPQTRPVGTSTRKGAVSLLISRGTNPSTTATVRRVDSAAPGTGLRGAGRTTW